MIAIHLVDDSTLIRVLRRRNVYGDVMKGSYKCFYLWKADKWYKCYWWDV
jgi:hypothetical protein